MARTVSERAAEIRREVGTSLTWREVWLQAKRDVERRTVTHVRYVDYGIGEYGFFGKTIAESNVTGMTAEEREREIAEVKALVGEHVQVIEVEAVPDA